MKRRSFYLAEFECPVDCPPLPSDEPVPLGGQSKVILGDIVKLVADRGYPIRVLDRSKPPDQFAALSFRGNRIMIFVDQLESGESFNRYNLELWMPSKDSGSDASQELDVDGEQQVIVFTTRFGPAFARSRGEFWRKHASNKPVSFGSFGDSHLNATEMHRC